MHLDTMERSAAEDGGARRSSLIAFVVTCASIVSRRPADFLRPQFFADDALFFRDAYNEGGLQCLFHPHSGYLNLIARLVAWAATHLPLAWAPLLFALVALVLHGAPTAFLFSRRCRGLGSFRWPIAVAYVGLPGTDWLNANLCHAQWHLAVLAFLMVVLADTPELGGRWMDRVVLLAIGLSSVFSVLLLPVAKRYRLLLLSTAAIQGVAFVLSGRDASPELDPSLLSLAAILANHVFVGALVGPGPVDLSGSRVALLVAGLGLALVGHAVRRGPSGLRRTWVFAGATLVASLAAPAVDWPRLALQGWAQRYWFLPALAFLCTLAWMACCERRGARLIGCCLLAPFLLTLPLTWVYPQRPDRDFPAQVAAFERLPSGASVPIRVNPEGWIIQLKKR